MIHRCNAVVFLRRTPTMYHVRLVRDHKARQQPLKLLTLSKSLLSMAANKEVFQRRGISIIAVCPSSLNAFLIDTPIICRVRTPCQVSFYLSTRIYFRSVFMHLEEKR